MVNSLESAIQVLQSFADDSLKKQLSLLERGVSGLSLDECQNLNGERNINVGLLESALLVKKTAAQINVITHAVGILLLLPYILVEGEVIEYVSLGAGNTGRKFDLETNKRIAEFKFIHWKGGSETIRKNAAFKDFYYLAEEATGKERYFYVIGTKYVLAFLNGERSLRSVMSRNIPLSNDFNQRYGTRFTKVRDYYQFRAERVSIKDVSAYIPSFAEIVTETLDDESNPLENGI